MDLKFEFSTVELQKNEFGKNDLIISKIKVMDENGKYIKFAKINKELIQALKNAEYVTIKKSKE
jgi:hypothetical protein